MEIDTEEDLIKKIEQLKKSEIKKKVDQRMSEFEQLHKKNNKEWFDELCFCILTANSSAELGIEIQNYMKRKNRFLTLNQDQITKVLKQKGYRFYNRRAEYIVEARKYKENIKEKIKSKKDQQKARKWLVNNIKGIGYKEGSHFLRNVGYKKVGILDRHILRIMEKSSIIEIPKTLTKKKYLNIEKKFKKIARKVNLKPGELDLYLWYTQTGEILK